LKKLILGDYNLRLPLDAGGDQHVSNPGMNNALDKFFLYLFDRIIRQPRDMFNLQAATKRLMSKVYPKYGLLTSCACMALKICSKGECARARNIAAHNDIAHTNHLERCSSMFGGALPALPTRAMHGSPTLPTSLPRVTTSHTPIPSAPTSLDPSGSATRKRRRSESSPVALKPSTPPESPPKRQKLKFD